MIRMRGSAVLFVALVLVSATIPRESTAQPGTLVGLTRFPLVARFVERADYGRTANGKFTKGCHEAADGEIQDINLRMTARPKFAGTSDRGWWLENTSEVFGGVELGDIKFNNDAKSYKFSKKEQDQKGMIITYAAGADKVRVFIPWIRLAQGLAGDRTIVICR